MVNAILKNGTHVTVYRGVLVSVPNSLNAA